LPTHRALIERVRKSGFMRSSRIA